LQSMKLNDAAADLRGHGLAGWLLRIWRSRASLREGRVRTLQLLETMPVGGKRQLMLVRCGEEHFLVGGGPESITAIVKVAGSAVQSGDRQC